MERGHRARGIKNVAMTEDFLSHHFPGMPIMPGALIAEAAMQLAGWLIREASDFRQSGLASHLERARFHNIVRPGDQLDIEVVVLTSDQDQARFKTKVRCRNKRVASGRFTLDIVDTSSLEAVADARRLYEILTVRKDEEQP